MRQESFVLAAYVVALVGLGGLMLWAWLSMRRTEEKADALSASRRSESGAG